MDINDIEKTNGLSVSLLEKTYNNVGEGFQEIMNALEDVNAAGGSLTVTDAMVFQHATFKFNMYQELVTKICSKTAAGINDVMKAQ